MATKILGPLQREGNIVHKCGGLKERGRERERERERERGDIEDFVEERGRRKDSRFIH